MTRGFVGERAVDTGTHNGSIADLAIVDGLVVSKWDRVVFEAMQAAGMTVANCTCCVWEDFEGTMENIAAFKTWFREHGDLIRQVYGPEDLRPAPDDKRVGVILGFQNVSAIEGNLEYLDLFHELGVRVIQLTYNTVNFVGAGCYETTDYGLTDFGRDVVARMNELGIVVDLSHVGHRTTRDAILASERPAVFSHVCPAALHDHPRNKTDEEMKLIVERGGLVGLTFMPWFLRAGSRASVVDCVDAIEYVVGLVGEEGVGIGTDFTEGHGPGFVEWILRDKGRGRMLTTTPIEEVNLTMPEGLRRIVDLPNLVTEMQRRDWPEQRIRRIMGENWLRVFDESWGPR